MDIGKRHEELKPLLQQIGILRELKASGEINAYEYDVRIKEVKRNWKKLKKVR